MFEDKYGISHGPAEETMAKLVPLKETYLNMCREYQMMRGKPNG